MAKLLTMILLIAVGIVLVVLLAHTDRSYIVYKFFNDLYDGIIPSDIAEKLEEEEEKM